MRLSRPDELSPASRAALGVSCSDLYAWLKSTDGPSSFYTYDDLAQIKAAGLNSLRIPIGYWAVDLADFEPYVDGQVSCSPPIPSPS